MESDKCARRRERERESSKKQKKKKKKPFCRSSELLHRRRSKVFSRFDSRLSRPLLLAAWPRARREGPLARTLSSSWNGIRRMGRPRARALFAWHSNAGYVRYIFLLERQKRDRREKALFSSENAAVCVLCSSYSNVAASAHHTTHIYLFLLLYSLRPRLYLLNPFKNNNLK